jgi:hypothetical protein
MRKSRHSKYFGISLFRFETLAVSVVYVVVLRTFVAARIIQESWHKSRNPLFYASLKSSGPTFIFCYVVFQNSVF